MARLANSLSYELIKAEAERGGRSKNPDAIDLDMRGRAIFLTRVQQGANEKDINNAAQTLFEQALAIDPNNADALADSAYTYFVEYYLRVGNRRHRLRSEGARSSRPSHRPRSRQYLGVLCQEFLSDMSRRLERGAPRRRRRASDQSELRAIVQCASLGRNLSRPVRTSEVRYSSGDAVKSARPDDRPVAAIYADAELGLGHFDAAIDAIQQGDRCRLSRNAILIGNSRPPTRSQGKADDAKAALAEARRLIPNSPSNGCRSANPFASRARRPAQGGAAGGMSESRYRRLRLAKSRQKGQSWPRGASTWRVCVHKNKSERKAMVSRRLFLQSSWPPPLPRLPGFASPGPRMRPASRMPRSRLARASPTADPLRATARSPGPRPPISR